jgi:nucleoside-diphosphate-sugar epimerase
MSLVRVAVLGGSGFVGGAVTRALAGRDVVVTTVSAPRLRTGARDVPGLLREAGAAVVAEATLTAAFAGIDVVVNASGDPDASATDLDRLVGANALMPVVAARAAERAGVRRFVHVSSAVVQGAIGTLDESEQRDPFSPYAMSKCLGEEALPAAVDSAELVIYRPPSVHGPDRRVTRRIASIACSPLRSVAGDGRNPSPQALIDNVGAAVAYLCTAARPPRVVIHPWEGLTVGSLMELLGRGRRPRHLPRSFARWAVRGARATVGWLPGRSADIRRVELLWFGQRQAESWLTRDGWSPPVGREGWRELADVVAGGRCDPARLTGDPAGPPARQS